MPADQLPEGTDSIIDGAGVDERDEMDADAIDKADAAMTVPVPLSSTGSQGEPLSLAGRVDALKGQAGDRAREFAQGVKDRATGGIDDMARMIEDAAAEVDAKVGVNYGDYVRRAAASVAGISDAIKDKDVDAIFADARAFAARSPGVTIGIAATLGFVVARLARAGLGDVAAPEGRKAA